MTDPGRGPDVTDFTPMRGLKGPEYPGMFCSGEHNPFDRQAVTLVKPSPTRAAGAAVW